MPDDKPNPTTTSPTPASQPPKLAPTPTPTHASSPNPPPPGTPKPAVTGPTFVPAANESSPAVVDGVGTTEGLTEDQKRRALADQEAANRRNAERAANEVRLQKVKEQNAKRVDEINESKVRPPNVVDVKFNFESRQLTAAQIIGLRDRLHTGNATEQDIVTLRSILTWLAELTDRPGAKPDANVDKDGRTVVSAEAGHDKGIETGAPASTGTSPRVAGHAP